MCPLVVKEFFISKRNFLFTTAANIAECAVNNEEIKVPRPECIMAKYCYVNVSRQIQTEKTLKHQCHLMYKIYKFTVK